MTDQNQRLFGIVRSGELGRIVLANFVLRGVLSKAWEDSESRDWWVKEDKAPGGDWTDRATYQTDRLCWLLGVESVDIVGYVASLRYLQLPVEDYGYAIFTFPDDVIATMENTRTGVDGAWRITTTLNEIEGSLTVNTIDAHVSMLRPDAGASLSWERLEPLGNGSDLIQPLVDWIREENNSLGTVRDAWRNLVITHAFHDAITSGTR